MSISNRNEDMTSIFVLKSTRERLKALGKKGETYDAAINRILNKVERKREP